jgi:hypothetical protein
MATRRSISVKIPTAKVIAALETKREEIVSARDSYPAKKREFDEAYEAWKAKVVKMVSKAKIESVSLNERDWRHPAELSVIIHYDMTGMELPPRPESPAMFGWREREVLEEIENAIRILKMTEQEEVSTSTYNAVAKYL